MYFFLQKNSYLCEYIVVFFLNFFFISTCPTHVVLNTILDIISITNLVLKYGIKMKIDVTNLCNHNTFIYNRLNLIHSINVKINISYGSLKLWEIFRFNWNVQSLVDNTRLNARPEIYLTPKVGCGTWGGRISAVDFQLSHRDN